MTNIEIGAVAGGAVVAVAVGAAIGNERGKTKAKKEMLKLAEEKGGVLTNEDIYKTLSERQQRKVELGTVPAIVDRKDIDKEIQKTLEALNKANKALQKAQKGGNKKAEKTA